MTEVHIIFIFAAPSSGQFRVLKCDLSNVILLVETDGALASARIAKMYIRGTRLTVQDVAVATFDNYCNQTTNFATFAINFFKVFFFLLKKT